VILDDILIHSDDLRASAALQVLAEIAQRTQVLFFTHHSGKKEVAGFGHAGRQVAAIRPTDSALCLP